MSVRILWKIIKKQKEKIVGLKKVNRLLGERCVQLLKDKGQLIDELTKKADTNHSLVEQMADLESNFRICEQNADTYYDQLTKAKELLKWWVNHCGYYDSYYAKKTEQFLQEIEK